MGSFLFSNLEKPQVAVRTIEKSVLTSREVEPTCLRVPEFEIAVIGSAEELGPCVVEANVSHCFAVA